MASTRRPPATTAPGSYLRLVYICSCYPLPQATDPIISTSLKQFSNTNRRHNCFITNSKFNPKSTFLKTSTNLAKLDAMAFFHHDNREGEQGSGRRGSVRDLQARAYAKWVAQATKPRKSSRSGFEAERSRRASLLEEAGVAPYVMRT